MYQLDLDSNQPPVEPIITNQSLNPADSVKFDQSPQLNHPAMTIKTKRLIIVVSFLAILAGAATGFGAFKLKNKTTANSPASDIQQVAEGQIKKGDIFGTHDDNFKDSAEGYLVAGGLNGEGSHQLVRAGGESQTVYLTSSVTDLDKLVGMSIKVWGETYKGQQVGWLMDVGKVEVLDPQAQAPTEAEAEL